MSPMLQSEIITFAILQQHRVNLYKKQSQFNGSFIFSEEIPKVVTEKISVVLRKNENFAEFTESGLW